MAIRKKDISSAGLLGACVELLGQQGFCPAIATWLNTVASFDFTMVFGYHRDSRPIDIYDDFPKDRGRVFVTDYQEGPYLLDPFYLAAIKPVETGLHRLRELAPDRFYQGEYFRSYYIRTAIAEEIGFFAEMPGACHVVLSLMRAKRLFSAAEFRRLQAVAPVVVALMRQQWLDLDRRFSERNDTAPRSIGQGLAVLTPREAEVVSYILKGHSAEATAAELKIATGTVRVHRRNIYLKLGISSQRELFAHFLANVSSASQPIIGER